MRFANMPLWSLAATLAVLAGTVAPTIVAAQAAAAGNSGAVLQVNTGRGRLVTLAHPMSDVFVADDKIADVQVRSPTQLYVFGKAQGETTVSATTKAGTVVYSATIRVGNNFDAIGQMLTLAMPESHIIVTPMNGLILLTGIVAAPDDAAEANRLVQAFVGDGAKVISRLKTATPLQVNLQVRFAEVSRSFVKNIGVNLTNRPASSSNNILFGVAQGRQGTIGTVPGDPNSTTVDATGLRPGATQFKFPAATATGTALALAGHAFGADLLASLDLGERDGQVTTLANPNLTALSGETGTFLAGGEIPIPVSQGLGAVSVEYKQYGVSLAYTPTVLADGRISLRVRPEVSQLSAQGAVTIGGLTVPALTTRRAETTVELGSGQSFMIAGLLQNNHNDTIDKAPGIGDLPVLGALFRSNAFQRDETELVIVITPYLVKPVNANEIVLPTDGYKAPTDLGRVLMGQIANGSSGAERPKPRMAPPAGNPAGMPAGAAPGMIGALSPLLPSPTHRNDGGPAVADRPRPPSATPGFSSN